MAKGTRGGRRAAKQDTTVAAKQDTTVAAKQDNTGYAMTDYLYHGTTMNGFIGIRNSGEIRMSSRGEFGRAVYLADSPELALEWAEGQNNDFGRGYRVLRIHKNAIDDLYGGYGYIPGEQAWVTSNIDISDVDYLDTRTGKWKRFGWND